MRISRYIISGHYVMLSKVGGSFLRIRIDDSVYITENRKTVAKIWRKEEQCANATTNEDEEKHMNELFQVINTLVEEKKLLLQPSEEETPESSIKAKTNNETK